jgi:hypothetical protein
LAALAPRCHPRHWCFAVSSIDLGAVAAVVIGGGAALLVVLTGLKVFPELAGIKSVEGLSTSLPPAE